MGDYNEELKNILTEESGEYMQQPAAFCGEVDGFTDVVSLTLQEKKAILGMLKRNCN